MKNNFTMFMRINLRKRKKKTKVKNDINVKFIIIFYYVIINKISEKFIYRKC